MNKMHYPHFLGHQLIQSFLPGLLAVSLAVGQVTAMSPAWAIEKRIDGTVDAILFNVAQKSFQIKNSAPLRATINSLTIQGNTRIILDIENAEVGFSMPRDAVLLKEITSRWPSVKNIAVNQFGGLKPVVRILLDLQGEDFTPQLGQNTGSYLELRLDQSASANKKLPALAGNSGGGAHANFDPFAPDGVRSAANRSGADVSSGTLPNVSPKTQTPQPAIQAPVQKVSSPIAQVNAPVVSQNQTPSPVLSLNPPAPLGSSYRPEGRPVTAQVPSNRNEEQSLRLQQMQERLDMLTRQLAQSEAAQTQLKQALQSQNKTESVNQANSVEELKKTLLIVNQRYDTLLKDNQKLRQEIALKPQDSQIVDRQTELQSQLNGLKRDLQSANDLIKRQNQDLTILKTQNQRLSSQVSPSPNTGSESQVNDLRAQLAASKKELLSVNELLKKQSQEVALLKSQSLKVASASQASQSTPDPEFQEIRGKLSEAKRDLVNAAELIKKQNQDIKNLKEQVKKNAGSDDSNYKAQLTYLNQKLELKEQEIKQLQSQPANRRIAAVPENNGEISALQEQVNALKRELNTSVRSLKSQEAELQQLRNQNRNPQNDNSEQSAIIANLNQRLQSQENEIRQLNQQLLTQQNNTVAAAPADSSQYLSKIKSMEVLHKDEVDQLKKELEQQDKMLEELSKQIEEMKSDGIRSSFTKAPASKSSRSNGKPVKFSIDEMKQTLVNMNRRFEEIQSEKLLLRNALDGEKASTQKRIKSLESQLTDLTDKYQLAVAETNGFKNQVQSLKQQEQKRDVQDPTKSQAFLALKSEKEGLLKELTTLKSHRADPRPESNAKTELNAKNEQMIRSLKADLAQQDLLIEKLNQQLKQEQQKLADNSAQPPSHSEKEIEALQNSLNTLNQNYESLRQEKEALEKKVQGKQNSDKLASSNESDKALAEAKKRIKTLEAQLNQEKSKPVGDKTAQSEKLAYDLRNLHVESGENAQKLASAEKQIRDLKQLLADSKKSQKKSKKEEGASSSTASDSQQSLSEEILSQAESAYNGAKNFEKRDEGEEAFKSYQQAAQMAPQVSKYVLAYSTVLMQRKNFPEATKVLQSLIEKDSTNKEAYNQLGKAYLLDGRPEEANKLFLSAIPTNALSNYATSLKKLGKMSEAEKVLKLALEVSPTDSDLLFNLGNLYNTVNNLSEAKHSYLLALESKPDFAEAHYNLGLLYSKLGEAKNAKLHLERFLELSPGTPNREAVQAYLKKLK